MLTSLFVHQNPKNQSQLVISLFVYENSGTNRNCLINMERALCDNINIWYIDTNPCPKKQQPINLTQTNNTDLPMHQCYLYKSFKSLWTHLYSFPWPMTFSSVVKVDSVRRWGRQSKSGLRESKRPFPVLRQCRKTKAEVCVCNALHERPQLFHFTILTGSGNKIVHRLLLWKYIIQ